MLPSPALKPVYDDIVWVYVYRDFTSKGLDHHAERISWRFGVSSWPQLFLADPTTLKILAHTGRQPDGFLQAVGRTKVKVRKDARGARGASLVIETALAAKDRADALEKRPSVRAATAALDDDDIVVRYLALRILAKEKPAVVAKRALALLETPNDPFRYEVCNVLKEAADPAAARALEALVRDPINSLNPNVVRIRAVQALATCGDGQSMDAIAPFATSGAYFNGLTGVAVDALAAIAKRYKKTRKSVQKILKSGYPQPPAPGNAREMRACVALAKRIHRATGQKRAFPGTYDAKARQALMR